MSENTNAFEGWAVVEMFGHVKEVGFVTTRTFGTAALFQIDTPELPEREFTLEQPEYADGKWTPIGAKVRRPASPAKSRLIGPGAVYSMTPCTEETAMRAIESFSRRPLILLELPKAGQELLPVMSELPEPITFKDDDDDDDEFVMDEDEEI